MRATVGHDGPGSVTSTANELQTAGSTSAPGYSFMTSNISTANFGIGALRVRANTSGQIRSRLSASDANTVLYIATLGWIDTRGRLN